MIQLTGISVRYAGNRRDTLSGVDWDIRAGEIHAIVGENGAGKSTLMHVLAGSVRPCAGSIRVDGRLVRLPSPAAARKYGIGMVRQRPELCPGLSVWEDCVLAQGRFFFPAARWRARVASLARDCGLDLPLDAPTATLSDAARHQAAVLALLATGARCLIFDEPSAVLSAGEAAALGSLFCRLAGQGHAVALITHNLNEALNLAHRVTAMRGGRTLETRPAARWKAQELEERLFETLPPSGGSRKNGTPGGRGGVCEANSLSKNGMEAVSAAGGRQGCRCPPSPAEQAGEELRSNSLSKNGTAGGKDAAVHQALPPLGGRGGVCEANSLSKNGTEAVFTARTLTLPPLRDLNFELAAGEVCGIAGLTRDGIETLELAACGFTRPAAGEILVGGRPLARGIADFRAAGGAYLASGLRRGGRPSNHTGDRPLAGYDRALSVFDNLVIHHHAPHWNTRALRARAAALLARAHIQTPPGRKLGTLSGGMLQRLMLERELETVREGGLLVISQALWGLDVARRRQLCQEIRAACRNRRLGVLLFAASTAEFAELCDRLFVLESGHLRAVPRAQAAAPPETAPPSPQVALRSQETP